MQSPSAFLQVAHYAPTAPAHQSSSGDEAHSILNLLRFPRGARLEKLTLNVSGTVVDVDFLRFDCLLTACRVASFCGSFFLRPPA